MKILFTADQHQTLRKSKVPKDWAYNRYTEFFNAIHSMDFDVHILGGDWFDKSPNIDELGIFLEFIESDNRPRYMIGGNHEATTKYKTFLSMLKPLEADNFRLMLDQETLELNNGRIFICFFSYHFIKLGLQPPIPPKAAEKTILISHARGNLPMVDPEYDFNRFSNYDLVLLGDLHTYHQHMPFKNVWYPGSPYSITFEQCNLDKEFGVFLIDTDKEDWYIPQFIPLDLPQLVKTVVAPEEVKKRQETESKHHFLIEVEGSVDELQGITTKGNVAKKVRVSNKATVDLLGKTRIEEVQAILEYMEVSDIASHLEVYREYASN